MRILKYLRNKPEWRPWPQHLFPFVGATYGLVTRAASYTTSKFGRYAWYAIMPIHFLLSPIANMVNAIGDRLFRGENLFRGTGIKKLLAVLLVELVIFVMIAATTFFVVAGWAL